MLGIPDFRPGPDYRYAMYLAASLMLGWTCLLIWADRKPLERRGVLVLTVFPVVAGLFLAGVYAVASRLVGLGHLLPMFVLQLLSAPSFCVPPFGRRPGDRERSAAAAHPSMPTAAR
jgi:hypothetical protein